VSRDPRASLSPTEITVTAGPATATIPASPAAVWLDALLDPDNIVVEDDRGTVRASRILDRVLRTLAGDRFIGDVFGAIAAGDCDYGVLDDAAQDLLSEASGRPWFEVVNLCVVITASWKQVGGLLVLRGLDPERLSLAAWLDGAHQVLREAVGGGKDGAEHLADLERRISLEPVARSGDESDTDMDEAEFLATAAAMM